MQVYDVIHGYQPFTNNLISPWVHTNLENTFLPTSEAVKAGLVRRNVQLQGWTIDAWLNANERIRKNAKIVLNNLRQAYDNDYIEIGASAYSHPILPFLGGALVYAQMKADVLKVTEHIGKPTFFWFPECAMNQKVLQILHDRFPKITPIIPDKSLGVNKSMFARVRYPDGEGKAYICNVNVKDALMNGMVCNKPFYIPKNLPWKHAVQSMRDPQHFVETIQALDHTDRHIVVRDWENAESRDALIKVGNKKEIAAMMKAKAEFKLLKENDEFDYCFHLNEFNDASWEPISSIKNPFPYWRPTDVHDKKKMQIDRYWLEMLDFYNELFENIAGKSKKSVDKAFKDEKFVMMFKQTSPALLSCLIWHVMARPEWESFPKFPGELTKRVVLPSLLQMIDYSDMPNKKMQQEKAKNLCGSMLKPLAP
jgi:hypothetical protein